MKKNKIQFILPLLLFPVFSFAQQWITSGANIYSNNAGNVGIGSTAPPTKLYVNGGSPSGNISFYVNGGARIGGGATIGRSGNQYDEFAYNLNFTSTPNSYTYLQTDAAASIRLGWLGDIEFRTAPNGTQGNPVTLTTRMQLKENGNLGIGTLAPTAKLDIAGPGSLMAKLHVTNAFAGTPGGSFDINMGAGDNYAAGIRGYVPADQPGIDRVYLGLYTTTYENSLMSRVERLTITDKGNVLIGKTSQINSVYKLDVNGHVRANEIVVNTTGADFVFADDFRLRPLTEVREYIEKHKHLPEIASAEEMQKDGVGIGDLQTKLLQKVEELTLYLIEQENKIQELEKQVIRLKQQSSK
jgi:hypothetical protein